MSRKTFCGLSYVGLLCLWVKWVTLQAWTKHHLRQRSMDVVHLLDVAAGGVDQWMSRIVHLDAGLAHKDIEEPGEPDGARVAPREDEESKMMKSH